MNIQLPLLKPVKLKIKLSSYKIRLLEQQCKYLDKVFKNNDDYQPLIDKVSIISLPTKKKKWTILKSPHIDKKSREQLEINTYQKMIILNFDSSISHFQDISRLFLVKHKEWLLSCEISISFDLHYKQQYSISNTYQQIG